MPNGIHSPPSPPITTPTRMPSLTTTPTGLQSMATLRRRRYLMLALNATTYVALLYVAAVILAAGGWTLVDGLLFLAFAVASPWTVLGFWNSVVGLWLLQGHSDGLRQASPYVRAGEIPGPLTIRTAVIMTVRNEDPRRAVARLAMVKDSIDATGEGNAFAYFVLSDTNQPDVAAGEEQAIAAWRNGIGPGEAAHIHYRRREVNAGFKAGNVRDFCTRWGGDYELMLPLDADSVMSGESIVRLVRMMQAHPRLGILQSLVVGMPTESAFARMFQFGMRQGMRPYTAGQAWWSGDCGPFWGHNALVRIRPFCEQCELPVLPGKPPLGGPVLSHDQVEATLMRRAGYEVRVLPVELGSWEENPPTMLDFAKRDIRWCQGNLQYVQLLATPGLYPVSRFQLIWAILMFIGLPAWTLGAALIPAAAVEAKSAADFPAGLALGLYLTFMFMFLSPKFAGLVDVAMTPGGMARYGGVGRFVTGAIVEFSFSFLQSAISTFRTSLFMVGLLIGRSVSWGGQHRDAYRITWGDAARSFWPQTLFGLAITGALYVIEPAVLLWTLPLTLGYVVAIPFAVWTAMPEAGQALKRTGLCGIPEDFDPPREVRLAIGEKRS